MSPKLISVAQIDCARRIILGDKVMKQTSKYFIIQNAQKAESGQMQLVGQFIVDGVVAVDGNNDGGSSSSSGGGSKKPPYKIVPPELFEVKYILPSKDNPFYDRIKAAAEGVGYETAEQDEFSYPPGL